MSEKRTTGAPRQGSDPRPQRWWDANSRMLELVALLALVGVATLVYAFTGPTGFSAVIGAGGGLFATWRTQRSADPGRDRMKE